MITINIKRRIKEYFFTNPTEKLRVRQIERQIQVPLPSAIRYAKELEKEKILKKTVTAGVTFYSADRSSQQFLIEKKLFNIKLLYFCGIIDYLILNYDNPVLISFGSFSKGEDIETSDVDLYIETPMKSKCNLEKFEKILQRKIQLFIYKNLRDIKNKELANNIVNGVLLNGFIEVFK